jgi:hypothetical protein
MPRPKMPVAEKKLRGTYEASRDVPANPGRIRLSTPIEPPGDLDKVAQSEWQLHMQLCLQAGTLAVTDCGRCDFGGNRGHGVARLPGGDEDRTGVAW